MEKSTGRSLILSGIKHSGKSTIGAMLANKLKLPFLDLDDLIMNLCRDDRGGPEAVAWEPREIYRRLGKSAFQALELRALESLKTRKERIVLALGGGTQESDAVRPLLSELGILVYLQAEAELLFERISARGIPPFLDRDNPRASFMELYARRDRLYRSTAELIFPVGQLSAEAAAENIITLLKEHHNGRQ